MKPYIVKKLQTIEIPIRVKASGKEEAKLKVMNGEGFPVQNNIAPKLIAMPDFAKWEVEEDPSKITIDNSHKIFMYTSSNVSNCPFCAAMVQFLNSYGIEFETKDIAKDEDSKKLLEEKTGNTRVPKLGINDKFVTGFNPVGLTNELKKNGVIHENSVD